MSPPNSTRARAARVQKGESVRDTPGTADFQFKSPATGSTGLVTDDEALAAKLRAMRNFGFGGQEEAVELGINTKMNEISAAMGLMGLDSFYDIVASNNRNYQRYKSELDSVPGVDLVLFDERERCNFQYVVVEVNERVAGLSRDQLLAVLQAENILTRRYFYPGCHRLPPYRADVGASSRLTSTEALAQRVLVLPTGTAVNPGDVGAVCEIVRLALAHSGEIRQCLLPDRADMPSVPVAPSGG